MNRLLFPPLLPYAETHYKFKLPWSPLHRPWPEIFIDGPSFCVPGVKPVFYLVVKDADYFPVRIRDLQISIQSPEGVGKQTIGLDFTPEENLEFLPLNIDFAGRSGMVSLNFSGLAEKRSGKSQAFLNSNFPGITPTPLLLRLLAHSLPYPSDWHAGEMHCHSDYSNDPVEFGAPLHALREAGRSLGMGFVMCTDHSYDFYYRKTRYMEPTDPDANFQAYRSEALALNVSMAGYPVMIPGEEVSCGNHLGENVHLLTAGHPEFLPGLGDGGRRWFNNKPDLSVGEVLERLGGTPSFAAHPKAKVGTLERMIFRRGMWHAQDLRAPRAGRPIDGLQFWNGHRGKDFHAGRDFWVEQLLAGKRLSPIAANDAHGDINRNIGVKTPLFSLYQGRNHVFGNVRTLVKSRERSMAGIQDGMRAGRIACTDGPFLELVREDGRLTVKAGSTRDFGGMARVALLQGDHDAQRETRVRDWVWKQDGPMDLAETIDWPINAAYVRAEVLTSEKRLALSPALFR